MAFRSALVNVLSIESISRTGDTMTGLILNEEASPDVASRVHRGVGSMKTSAIPDGYPREDMDEDGEIADRYLDPLEVLRLRRRKARFLERALNRRFEHDVVLSFDFLQMYVVAGISIRTEIFGPFSTVQLMFFQFGPVCTSSEPL